MSEMREYQQKLIKSRSNVVIGDWNRRVGKTSTIAESIWRNCGDIIEDTIKVLVVSGYEYKAVSNLIQDYLDGITDNNIEVVARGFNKMFVKYEGSMIIDITFTNSIENSRGMKVDYVYCDEYMPSSNEISIFNNSGAKRIYILGTFDFEYISDKENKIEINEQEWVGQQIKELMKEFAEIPKRENTTKTREVILGMIMRLESMKPRNLHTVISTDDCGREEKSGLFKSEKQECSGLFGYKKEENSGLFKDRC